MGYAAYLQAQFRVVCMLALFSTAHGWNCLRLEFSKDLSDQGVKACEELSVTKLAPMGLTTSRIKGAKVNSAPSLTNSRKSVKLREGLIWQNYKYCKGIYMQVY